MKKLISFLLALTMILSFSIAAYATDDVGVVAVSYTHLLPEGVEGEPDSGLMKIDFDETYWEKGDDGYYYYVKALNPGAVTEPLFASVSFDSAMGNIYQNSTAKVDVTAYAVQAANNGDGAMDAKGWPKV